MTEEKRQEIWQSTGRSLRELRESYGFSLTRVARNLNVSAARLKRLEQGEPVRDVNLLRSAYLLLMRYEDVRKQA